MGMTPGASRLASSGPSMRIQANHNRPTRGCARSSCSASGGRAGQSPFHTVLGQRRNRNTRGVHTTTRVIPSLIGDAATQPPPDLPSFLFKERIVYLGMTLVPSVTELLVAQFLYLQFEDPQKPIYFYINSTGTTKEDDR